MCLDGLFADVQLPGDLAVPTSGCDQGGDLQLHGGQLLGGPVGARHRDPGGAEFCGGSVGPRVGAIYGERLASRGEFDAGVQDSLVTAQELAVDELGAGDGDRIAGGLSQVDGPEVRRPVGGVDEGARPGRGCQQRMSIAWHREVLDLLDQLLGLLDATGTGGRLG